MYLKIICNDKHLPFNVLLEKMDSVSIYVSIILWKKNCKENVKLVLLNVITYHQKST